MSILFNSLLDGRRDSRPRRRDRALSAPEVRVAGRALQRRQVEDRVVHRDGPLLEPRDSGFPSVRRRDGKPVHRLPHHAGVTFPGSACMQDRRTSTKGSAKNQCHEAKGLKKKQKEDSK